MMKEPRTLFLSYAHEDELLCKKLEVHLSGLKRERLISIWHARQIAPGAEWSHEIESRLNEAAVIILLVSPDFIASDYCYEREMQRALERHKRGEAQVIPIILRDCDWQATPLSNLQCLPRDGQPVTLWKDLDQVFRAIVQEIRCVMKGQATSSSAPLSSRDRQGRLRLLKRVRQIWIEGVMEHSLPCTAPLPLTLQERSDALSNSLDQDVQEARLPSRLLPADTSIVQVYDNAEGELLILGRAGSGKTTLLLELTRTLLERAEKAEGLPMPVVFPLASWTKETQQLRLWMVEELSAKYDVPREIGQHWIETNQILPLLDGLDEVAKEVRAACVQQINDYRQWCQDRYGRSPIVVCCRSQAYAALSKHAKRASRVKLKLLDAVGIRPLTDEQINAYLEQIGESAKALKQALSTDVELHRLALQPLMLRVLTLAYQGVATEQVLMSETNHEKKRHIIFAKYVESMFDRRKKVTRWKREQFICGLAFLAKQMQQHNLVVFSVEQLQPTWLTDSWRMRYQLSIRLLCGLIFGVLGGVIFGIFYGAASGLTSGLFGGLIFGLISGVCSGLIGVLSFGIKPAEVLAWSWKKAWSGMVPGLFGGLILGLISGPIFGLFSGLFSEPHFWLILNIFASLLGRLFFGLAYGLFFGLLVGLISGLSGRQLPKRLSPSPNEGIWRSGKNGLIFWLVSGLLLGLLSGLVFGFGFGLTFGMVLGGVLEPLVDLWAGLTFGLFFGLPLGLFFGLEAFVKHFILRFFLSRQGDLPWDLIPFLDQAAERSLLLKAGGSYVFLHRLLLDYFASLDESTVPMSSISSEDET